tara:strand:- start:261 stop:455 length:195 start_codon:yes stop_codon:yes gene_type:complete
MHSQSQAPNRLATFFAWLPLAVLVAWVLYLLFWRTPTFDRPLDEAFQAAEEAIQNSIAPTSTAR